MKRQIHYKGTKQSWFEQNYRKLFLETKGSIVISSSIPGEYAWGTAVGGGIYTQEFIKIFNEQVKDHYRLIVAQCSDNSIDIIGNSRSLREFNLPLNNCRILEISNFNLQENRISLVLNNCLAGPQTPEKAKQASFVALDVRKKRFGSFDKVDDPSFKNL